MKFDKSNLSLWLGGISILVSIIIFAYWYTQDQKISNLEIITLSKSKIITLNEEVSGLSIFYNNEDLKLKKKNLTVFTLRIINSGELPILSEYIDKQLKFGIIISKGQIVDIPEMVNTSDTTYFKNVINQVSKDRITFSEFIFNSGDYFDVKFMTVHKENNVPEIVSFGKVANQNYINISNIEIPILKNKDVLWTIYMGINVIIVITVVVSFLFFKKLIGALRKDNLNNLIELNLAKGEHLILLREQQLALRKENKQLFEEKNKLKKLYQTKTGKSIE